MKKLLIIMPELYYGGAEKQFRYLIDGLGKYNNIQLSVCIEHSYNAKLKASGDVFEKEHSNINFIHMDGLDAKNGKLYKLKSAILLYLKLNKKLNKIVPDIILGYGPLFSAIIPLLKKKNRKIVLGERCDGKYSDILTKQTTKKADMVIANSRAATEYMRNNQYENVYCITNGIDLKSIDSKEKLFDKSKLLIFMPARVSDIKNQKQVIEAIKLIKDFTSSVIFAGEIQDKVYYEECKKLINKYNLNDNVKFIGVVDNVGDYYNKCDLVMLPSKFEGTPNVILEGFAYKRICITSDIIMNKDVIRNENLMFPLDSPSKMAEVIKYVHDLPVEKKNEIVKQNYKYVSENYSVDKMVKSYIKLLEL